MPQLTIADLLAHRVALREQEAAALTLAVAHALDHHRRSNQSASVPEDRAIALHRDGRVTFLYLHQSSAVDDLTALSSLLLRLLSVNIPEGVGRLVSDSETPVGLRAVLLGMSSDDPAVLAAVYWRAASAIRRRPRADEVRTERRRQHPPATDLRRHIRHLEQQLFTERVRALRGRWIQRRARRMAWIAWLSAAACTLVVATTLAWTYRTQPLHSLAESASVEPIAEVNVATPPASPDTPVRSATVHHHAAPRAHDVHRRPAAVARRAAVRVAKSPAAANARRNASTVVPWGTRTAAWTITAR